MTKLDEIRRKLDSALREGKITKEIHDEVLNEALAKHQKKMMDYARQLAEIENIKSRDDEISKSLESKNKKKVPKNWIILGMFAVAAFLAMQQLHSRFRSKSTGKDRKTKPTRKKK
ncbi:hypothetical protein [[Eubacterium] cellulosolvens]